MKGVTSMNYAAHDGYRDDSTDCLAYSLTVEGMRTPLGVDARNPVFRWRHGRDAISATTVRVRLWENDRSDPVWDSGTRELATAVPYAGTPLVPLTRYRWQVEVVSDGSLGAAESWFETGLIDIGSFGGSWISRDPRRTAQIDPPDMGEMGWRQGLKRLRFDAASF